MDVHSFMRKYEPIQGQQIQYVLLSTPCIQQTAATECTLQYTLHTATIFGRIFHTLTKNDFVLHTNDL
jgi:hypothetical protein